MPTTLSFLPKMISSPSWFTSQRGASYCSHIGLVVGLPVTMIFMSCSFGLGVFWFPRLDSNQRVPHFVAGLYHLSYVGLGLFERKPLNRLCLAA